MPVLAPGSDAVQRIDAALRAWSQGDLALDEDWFVHVADPAAPLTEAAAEAEAAGLQVLTTEATGLVVVTQTCDVVRTCTDRPYVEVAPLVALDPDAFGRAEHGHQPRYAPIPAAKDRRLVAHLDRIMTVEKAVVAEWARTPGCTSDVERRAFAEAVARMFARFAFPDDFVAAAGKLKDRLKDKHEKNSDEGRGLRALRQIRVQASPSWDADEVSLMLWFIRNEADADFEGRSWHELLEAWLALLPATGRFVAVDGQVVTLEDMTAADYVASDPFDLDHLSAGRASTAAGKGTRQG